MCILCVWESRIVRSVSETDARVQRNREKPVIGYAPIRDRQRQPVYLYGTTCKWGK